MLRNWITFLFQKLHNQIMTDFKKKFAKRLKELRTFAGITQEELASAVGVETKTVSYWENGHNSVTFNKLPVIAKALNIPVYKLFVFGEILNGDNSEVMELLDSLNDRERRCVSDVIKAIIAMK